MTQPSAARRLLGSRTIAIVGLSKDPAKPSHDVALYLKKAGWKIIPVNPTASEVLGLACYPSLGVIPAALAQSIEVVAVFRKSEDVPTIVAEAVRLKQAFGRLKGVWLQLGIENPVAREMAEKAGLAFVENQCMKIEHQRLLAPRP